MHQAWNTSPLKLLCYISALYQTSPCPPTYAKFKKEKKVGWRDLGENRISKPSFPLLWHCFKSAYGKFASVIITWTHLGMRLAARLVFPLNIFMISMHRRSRIRMNVFGTVQINSHKCSTTALEMHSAEM